MKVTLKFNLDMEPIRTAITDEVYAVCDRLKIERRHAPILATRVMLTVEKALKEQEGSRES